MSVIKYNSLPTYILLVLYIFTGAIPALGSIDILAPQWVYFGSINILTSLYFFFNSNKFKDSLTIILKSYFFGAYFILIVWATFSYFYAINQVETLINLPRYFNVFIACIFSYLLISKLLKPIVFVTFIFLGFLIVEIVAYFNDFFDVYSSTEYFSLTRVKGVSGNKNITAASIAFKIPIVLYLINTTKSNIIKFICFFILVLSFLSISLVNARAAILSSSLVVVLYVGFFVFNYIRKKISLKSTLVSISYGFLSFLLSFSINEFLASNANTNSFTKTVGKIQFNNEASNGRFDYWFDVYNHLKDNPVIGCGLGNWKIASIEYGKRHINGYTVPYHAHNDFLQFFSELGIVGGILYLSIFIFLFINLLLLLIKSKLLEKSLVYFILGCSLLVYSLDASLNFPIARPLMQSSLVIMIGVILFIIFENKKPNNLVNNTVSKIIFSVCFVLIVLSTSIHYISFNSLTKQGRLLYEFNNNKFDMSLEELDKISDDFPNLTETALPIKAMKARYFYLNDLKEKAHIYATNGSKDNPFIYFPENLKAQFFFQEGKIDSAYVYSKVAFDNIPRNKPHFDLYIKTLIERKDIAGIENAFSKAQEVFGNDPVIWQLYLQALARTRSIGDPYAMQKGAEAFNLYRDNESIFTLYKILTYGQSRMMEAEKLGRDAVELYKNKLYDQAFVKFKEANNLDPLDPVFPLNAGFALFESKKFDRAISFFNLVIPTKHTNHSLRAMRYKALSLINLNRRSEACKLLDQLRIKGKKRMYFQEYQKYCK